MRCNSLLKAGKIGLFGLVLPISDDILIFDE